jgi:hypothetical protein
MIVVLRRGQSFGMTYLTVWSSWFSLIYNNSIINSCSDVHLIKDKGYQDRSTGQPGKDTEPALN